MGVGLMVGAVLLGGYMQGRAQQQQYKAQAAQAEANANIAYNNAEKLKEQAESQARANEMNEENKRRKLLIQQGQQRANVGAAGIQATGSAAAALADNAFNAEQELAIDRYNARQQVDTIYNQSTDYVNQGDIYTKNAQQYRKAGKRAMMNSMLQSTMSLATTLYSANSVGKLNSSTQATETSASLGGYKPNEWTSYYQGTGSTGKVVDSYQSNGWTFEKPDEYYYTLK